MNNNNTKQGYKFSFLKITLVLLIFGMISCSTKKQILYLQDIDTYNNSEVLFLENTIQHNDILSVVVSSSIIETAAPYNKAATATISAGQNRNYQNQGYLVSKDLEIKLPILGNVGLKPNLQITHSERRRDIRLIILSLVIIPGIDQK